MNPLVAVLISSLAVIPSVVATDGVEVEVLIQAQVYVWRVTNVGAAPITKFQVEHRNCYTQLGPPGWKITLSDDEQTMYAETTDPLLAIRPGRSADFRATVTSHGATLGAVPMVLTTADGNTIHLEVQGPVRMPQRAVLTAVATLCLVGLLHAWIVRRRGPGS